MKYLLIAILFVSCSTYKAYQKIAADPFVDARESILLSQKCLTVYPAIRDSAKTIVVDVDSSAYNAMIDAYNVLIDSLISQYAVAEVGLFDTNDVVTPVRKSDSLRVIRNFLRTFRPPPLIKTQIKEVPTVNGAWMDQKQREIEACRAEKNLLFQDYTTIKTKLDKRNREKGWIIAGGLLLVILAYGSGRLIRKV